MKVAVQQETKKETVKETMRGFVVLLLLLLPCQTEQKTHLPSSSLLPDVAVDRSSSIRKFMDSKRRDCGVPIVTLSKREKNRIATGIRKTGICHGTHDGRSFHLSLSLSFNPTRILSYGTKRFKAKRRVIKAIDYISSSRGSRVAWKKGKSIKVMRFHEFDRKAKSQRPVIGLQLDFVSPRLCPVHMLQR